MQPELGLKLARIRNDKRLTQEELVERSNVSVRTIQRIEAGEVIPRLSTVKILAKALEVDFESIFQTTQNQMKESNTGSALFNPQATSKSVNASKDALMTAAISGAIYLVLEIIKTALDIAWLVEKFGREGNVAYIIICACIAVSYSLFIRGFIIIGHLFENNLLRISGYFLMISMIALSAFDVYSLFFIPVEMIWFPYGAAAVVFGVLGIIFGVSLLKLQDGMGELSKVAGLMEIAMGTLLATVFLFFLAYAVMIPAVIIEIILLYRGYEYLSRENAGMVLNA